MIIQVGQDVKKIIGTIFPLRKTLTKERYSCMIRTMKAINSWLNKQHKALGTWDRVAQEMGITVRHLRNIRKGHGSSAIKRIILYYAKGIKP